LATDRVAKAQLAVPVHNPTSYSGWGSSPIHAIETTTVGAEVNPSAHLASVREHIFATVVERVLAWSRDWPVAVVAGGSFGRKEDTILVRDGRAGVLGDAEFFLIYSTGKAAQKIRGVLDDVVAEAESQLADRGIDCHVTCSAVPAEILQKMSPHILALELRETGKVLWGDPQALDLIPPFSLASIPKWDAWRSVSNRMIEQLNYVDALWSGDRSRVAELVYWTLKIQLELATLVLLFEGAYRPTYRERAEELQRIQGTLGCASWGVELANRLVACTDFKLNPHSSSPYAAFFSGRWGATKELAFAREEFLAVLGLVRRVWLWGAEQLVGRELDKRAQPIGVGLHIAQRQAWRWRVRGWARLGLTDRDWLTAQGWERFLGLALRGSPRFLLYAVSAALYFAAEDWLAGDATSANQQSERAMRYFPFPRQNTASLKWSQASQMVVAAWDHFLRQSWA
jgi:hypothetical protein